MATNIIKIQIGGLSKYLTQQEWQDDRIGRSESESFEFLFYACPSGKRAKVYVHNLHISYFGPSNALSVGYVQFGNLKYRVQASNGTSTMFTFLDISRTTAREEITTGSATAAHFFNYLDANPNTAAWNQQSSAINYMPKLDNNYFYLNENESFLADFWSGNSNAASVGLTINALRATIIEEDI